MQIEERESKRGHAYKVVHGSAMSVSVFQGRCETTGKLGTVKVRWPFPGDHQEKKVFGEMESAMTFAIRKAGDEG